MDYTFRMTSGFAPEEYRIINNLGTEVGRLKIRNGCVKVYSASAADPIFVRHLPLSRVEYVDREPEEVQLQDAGYDNTSKNDSVFSNGRVRVTYMKIAQRLLHRRRWLESADFSD